MFDLAAAIRRQIAEHNAAVEEAIMRSILEAFREGMCAELHIEQRSGLDVTGDRVTRLHPCAQPAHHQGEHDYPTMRRLD